MPRARYDESVHLHLVSVRKTSRLLDPGNEVVDYAWPCSILGVERQSLIVHTLQCKLRRLVPHILTNSLRPVLLKILDPQIQPVDASRFPLDTWCGEEHAPVDGCVLEWHCLLSGLFGANEGVAVDTLEKGAIGGEEGGLRIEKSGLFWDGVESFLGDRAV